MHLNNIIPFILTALVAYLLGSLSFSVIFTKILKNTDVRQHGSGNAGTTNVLRTAGKLPALLTLIFDFLKMVLAIYLAIQIFNLFPVAFISNNLLIKYFAGFFCIIGHIYPLYFGFKGGKGVLTSAALVLLIDWRVFAIVIPLFIICVAITKIISLSSLIAATALTVSTFFIQLSDYHNHNQTVHMLAANTFFAFLITALIFFKHIANIKRLINGTESKFGTTRKVG